MSLVGTRPILQDELLKYELHHRARIAIKPGMDRLVEDYVGDKIPLWEKIMDRQGTVCCAWEKIAFEEGLKVGIRLMMEAYSL